MYFRYRARNFRETLSEEELTRWERFRLGRVSNIDARQRYEDSFAEARERAGEEKPVFKDLEEYVSNLIVPVTGDE
jgi:exonuclease I